MLATWTKLLPFFVVMWITKRKAERVRVQSMPEFVSTMPYRGVVISWRR
jgi:hypothetical protein